MNQDTKITTLKRRVAAKVAHMTPADAQAWLDKINAERGNMAGATIFQAAIRELTGGFNSQNINFYVVRKLFDRSRAKVA